MGQHAQSWPPSRRIRRQTEFARVYAEGRKAHGRYLICFACAADTVITRIGLTVGKKVGNAVIRNRVRRRLRDVLRHRYADLPPGMDLVIVARHTAVGADRAAVAQDLDRCLARLTPAAEPER